VPAKPLPVIDEASRPFFDGALIGKLMLLRCRVCDTWMWPVGGLGTPVRPCCLNCFSRDLEWKAASGKATLYSYALMHVIYHPSFADEVPYNIAMVALEEGVRFTTQVVECGNDDLVIGMPLEVVFDRVTPDIAVPRFRPRS
jgi:uncharacterized OB-fold protein